MRFFSKLFAKKKGTEPAPFPESSEAAFRRGIDALADKMETLALTGHETLKAHQDIITAILLTTGPITITRETMAAASIAVFSIDKGKRNDFIVQAQKAN